MKKWIFREKFFDIDDIWIITYHIPDKNFLQSSENQNFHEKIEEIRI